MKFIFEVFVKTLPTHASFSRYEQNKIHNKTHNKIVQAFSKRFQNPAKFEREDKIDRITNL